MMIRVYILFKFAISNITEEGFELIATSAVELDSQNKNAKTVKLSLLLLASSCNKILFLPK
jgi:hypothetical protein